MRRRKGRADLIQSNTVVNNVVNHEKKWKEKDKKGPLEKWSNIKKHFKIHLVC